VGSSELGVELLEELARLDQQSVGVIQQLAGALFSVVAVHGQVSTPPRLARNGGHRGG